MQQLNVMSVNGWFTLAQTSTPDAAPAQSQPIAPAGMPGAATTTTPGGTGVPATGGGAASSPMGGSFLWMMLLLLAVMIGMTLLTGRRDKKKRAELMKSMQRGDKVQTHGGIIGTIAELSDSEVVLRVEEGRIRFSRGAIQALLPDGKAVAMSEPKDAANRPVGSAN